MDDSQEAEDAKSQLEVARRFLDDADVRRASRDAKVAFLTSKGIRGDDIQKLLAEEPQDDPAVPDTETKQTTETPQTTKISPPSSSSIVDDSSRPPVVTYPEFLAKPQRPPPLVTSNALLNTLYAFIGLSTIVYGTSKYTISPMVGTLTEARSHLYATASEKLRLVVSKLEKTVSTLPPVCQSIVAQNGDGDNISDDDSHDRDGDDHGSDDLDDPYGMVHRDVGTQTCAFFVHSVDVSNMPDDKAKSLRHADRLATATRSLSTLKDQLRAQSEDLEETRSLLDVFRDELDTMTYSGQTHIMSGFNLYGPSSQAEPDDEIRKVRDSIRRVKGVLLSTRNFPTSFSTATR